MAKSRIDREKTAEMFLSTSTIRDVENKEKKVELKKEVPEKKKVAQKQDIEIPKYIQKAYYVTQEQHKSLRLMAVKENENISFLVREALDQYFDSKK